MGTAYTFGSMGLFPAVFWACTASASGVRMAICTIADQ